MLSTVFFPELLTAFHQDYPEIAVVLEEYGSVRACNLVQNDTLDLALVNMEQYNIDKFHNVVLANDQVVFCVNKDHRLADKEIVTKREAEQKTPLFFCTFKYYAHICCAKQYSPDWLSMCIV